MASARAVSILFVLAFMLLVIPMPASATVAASITSSANPTLTGAPTVLSWTKTSDNAGDGTQTGNIVVSYTGPISGSLTTQAYTFAALASITKTFTVYMPYAGVYDFFFDDQPSAGTATDKHFVLTVDEAFVLDWTNQPPLGSSHDYFTSVSTGGAPAVDPDGNVYYAVARHQTGQSTGSLDGYLASYDMDGNFRWAQSQSASATNTAVWTTPIMDGGGRLLAMDCIKLNGVFASFKFAPIQASTGNLGTETSAPAAYTDCNAGEELDAIKVSNTVSNIFLKGKTGVSSYRIELFNNNFASQCFTTNTGSSNQGMAVKAGNSFGIEFDSTTKAFNMGTCAFGTNTASNANSYGPPQASQLVANKYYAMSLVSSNIQLATVADASALPTTIPTAALTPSRPTIDDTQTTVGTVQYLDVSGTDQILLCGSATVSGSNIRPFLMLTDSSGVVQAWRFFGGSVPDKVGSGSNPCQGLAFDGHGGLYALARDFNGPSTNSLSWYVQHYTLASSINNPPTLPAQGNIAVPGVSGTSTTSTTGAPASSTGNPLGNMVSFLSTSWGFDWSWLIGMILFLVVIVPIAIATKGNPMICGAGILVMDVANIKLGLWEEWSLLAMVFVIIALAANRLFGNKAEGESA